MSDSDDSHHSINAEFTEEQKIQLEQRIFRISIVGSIIFLVIEIVLAKITGSRSVLMDCVFDIADMVMLGPFLILIPMLYRPTTEKHPFGYAQVESLFILIKCGLLIFITADMVISNIKIIAGGGNEVDAVVVVIYEISVSAACFVMYLTLKHMNKKAASPSVDTEIYIWKLDSLSTLGVGAAFLVQLLMMKAGWEMLVPYIDPGVALIIGVVLLREPVVMFITALRNLMLFAPDEETREKIRDVAEKHLSKYNYQITAIETIRTGRKIWVEVYLKPEGDVLYMHQMREVCLAAGDELREDIPELWVEFLPDLEEKVEIDQEFSGHVSSLGNTEEIDNVKKAKKKAKKERNPEKDRKKQEKKDQMHRKTVRKV